MVLEANNNASLNEDIFDLQSSEVLGDLWSWSHEGIIGRIYWPEPPWGKWKY